MNNQRKRVILIVDNSISFTGAFKCALTEATLLCDEYTFVFVVPAGSGVVPVLQQNGFTYYELPFAEIGKSLQKLMVYGPRLFQNALRLKRILKKEKVDVLQVNDFYNLLGVAVKLLGYKARLITYVRFLPNVFPAPLRKLWIILAQKYSHAVIAVSKAVLKQLPEHPRNHMIYDAVGINEQLPAKGIDITHKSITFLYLANYIRGKGQDFAVRAFKEVATLKTQAILKFVGGDMGIEKNKAFKEELEQYVEDHQLSGKIIFSSFTDDVEREIKYADVVLNFSEAESFSLTCLEASFYGVPVIATRCGGPEEIIEHEHTGWLVENKNISEMTNLMLSVSDLDKKHLYKIGLAAKRYVRNKFDPVTFKTHITSILNKTYDEI